jgi:hypothetical protein
MSFSEQDWKRLRQLKPVALDRYCNRVLEESATILAASGRTAHERYVALYRLLQNRDNELASAFDDVRRSTALARLLAMRKLEVVTDEELQGFSPGTRETVVALRDL